MKKILVIFLFVAILIAIALGYGKVKIDPETEMETVNELIESIEEDEKNTMVCTKKGGDINTEQKIEIIFNNDGVVEEVLITEKYNSKELAQSSYENILNDSSIEEIILDGNILTYNATNNFEYKGKTKEEMINIMNAFEQDGIHTGYVISWK
ncbi:MAG: hypothetical protein MJ245_00165 [Clostridia bacterium]|nr:hypothetical protein [Clostridia bacterium]